jgi:hypothetical protein
MERHEHYQQMVLEIITAQIEIIGPVAVEQAKKVEGLDLDWEAKKVTISGDQRAVINELVEQYKILFGQISVEVCKEAISRHAQVLSAEDLPETLR